MDELFSKAAGAFELLENKAVSAIETTLYEYKPGGEAVVTPLADGKSDLSPRADLVFAPSALSSAKRLLEFWEEFDLESKKAEWEETGVQIAQNQELSTKSRRGLAEQTRIFKSEADKRDPAPLLKAYQSEIDSLTKRAKFAETSYLQVYRLLYDAPDVVPSLKTLVDVTSRVAQAEQDARRSRQELEVVRKEAANVKTLQAAVRRLEERNAELEEGLERKVEQIVQLKHKETEKHLEAMHERERAQQLQLEAAGESLAALQRLHEKAQSDLFVIQTQTEEERAAKQYEVEMVTEEIERAQERARSLEAMRLEMTAELEALRAVGVAAEVAANDQSLQDLEENLASKEKLISKLHEQMQQLEHTLAGEREEHLKIREKLEELIDTHKQVSDALRAELAQRPTVGQLDELRKQAQVLQALIGTDVDEEWDIEKTSATNDEEGTTRVLAALKDANRRLMAEVTTAKMTLTERTRDLTESNSRVHDLEKEMKELQALVKRLEDDILKGSRKTGPEYSWLDGGAEGMGELLRSQSSGGAEPSAAAGGTGVASVADAVDDESTMLAIVCGQRERFGQRVKELEEQQGRLLDQLGKSNAEVERLKEEGVTLYEKIKYLELYNKQTTTVRRVGGPNSGEVVVFGGGTGLTNSRYKCFGVADPVTTITPPPPMPDGSSGVGAEMRYRKLYEERMNPFNEFHQREQERSYRNLRLHDKITLTSGRFFLSNKYGRTFIFLYSILLHVLIFFVLYRSSHYKKTISGASQGMMRTSSLEASGPEAHTLADAIAERMGTLIETTRDLTKSGGNE